MTKNEEALSDYQNMLCGGMSETTFLNKHEQTLFEALHEAVWIDCRKQLPDTGKTVLIEGGTGYYCGVVNGRHEWRSSINGYPIEWNVTHWKHIPKLEV